MSADCSETTRLLGGDDAETFRMMGDTGRMEEEFYKKNSPWGQLTKNSRYPSILFTIYLISSLLIPLSVNMIIGVWALLKALTYFPITPQPATTVFIISTVIIMMTVVMVLSRFVVIIACRFEGASTKKIRYGCCCDAYYIYNKLEILSVFIIIIAMTLLFALGIVTNILKTTYVPDANARSANSSFDNYLTNQTIQKTWNMAQEDLKCCGLDSFTDYENLFNNLSVPLSCCNITHPLVNQSACPEIVTNATLANLTSQIYTEGCVSHLESFYQYIYHVVGQYYIIWGGLLIYAAMFVCCALTHVGLIWFICSCFKF